MSTSNKPRDRDTVRILVLETDEPHPETQDRKGSFGQIFSEVFSKAGDNHDPPLGVETEMHYVVNDPDNGHYGHVPSAAEIDPSITAILITGSMYDAHGSDPWILKLLDQLESLWKERPDMRFSGVCFGHQILCRMLGSKVEATPGGDWELAHTEMALTPTGQALFRTSDKTLSLHQMHQDQVMTVPNASTSTLLEKDQKAVIWATSEHTKIQGLYIRERLFTSQGHLGFDESMVRKQM